MESLSEGKDYKGIIENNPENESSVDTAPDHLLTLSNVVQKAAKLLGCSRLLLVLSDPTQNKFVLLPSSWNAEEGDLEALQQPEVSSQLSQILLSQMLSIDTLEPIKNVAFTLPLIYHSINSQGMVTSQIPVGVMIGFGDKQVDDSDMSMLNVFSTQISQLIASADFLPKIQSTVTNYKTAVTSFPIGVTFLDKEGIIFELNPSMQLLKLDESAKGAYYKGVFHKESSFLVPMIDSALASGTASKQTLTIKVTEGSETYSKTLQIQVQPTFVHTSSATEIVGASIAVFDISQGVAADETLTNSVMATISHDLRTPLTVISGYSQTLTEMLRQDGAIDADFGIEFLEGITAQAGRMQRLVGDLLDSERIASGHSLSLVKGSFDLINATSEVVKAQQSFSAASTIIMNTNVDQLNIVADKDRIEQVIANYLNNAVKYSPKGGVITVDITATDKNVHVAVTDQGIGIPPEQLQRLFGRLFRVESEKHEGIKGTGLGLFLCKNLIDLHGGTVDVQSVYGQGSTFSFTLPL